jgi:hypothetical protein
MSGIITDNLGRSTGLIKSAGGGGVVQIKETLYKAQSTLNSATYAVFHADFAVTITPTASNSSFLIDAIIWCGFPNHDVNCTCNVFDSQVGTSSGDEIFDITDVSSGNRTLAYCGGQYYGSGDATTDRYLLVDQHVTGLYTPTSNNGSARTFTACSKRNSADYNTFLNYSQEDSSVGFASVSLIRVTEIANSVT